MKTVTITFTESSTYRRDLEVEDHATEEEVREQFEFLPGEEQKRGADCIRGSWAVESVDGV